MKNLIFKKQVGSPNFFHIIAQLCYFIDVFDEITFFGSVVDFFGCHYEFHKFYFINKFY